MSQKPRKQKKVVLHKHSFAGGVEQLLDRMNQFGKEWSEKHNALAADLEELKSRAGSAFDVVDMNQQKLSAATAHQDFNIAAMDRLLRRAFLMLEVMGVTLDSVKKDEFTEDQITELTAKANDRYQKEMHSAFAAVAAEIKAAQEAAEKAKQEAARAEEEFTARAAEDIARKVDAEAVDAIERTMAEQALSESAGIEVPTGGGRGASFPEGATIF